MRKGKDREFNPVKPKRTSKTPNEDKTDTTKRKERVKIREIDRIYTSFGNVEPKVENGSTNIARKPGLVGAIDGDYVRVTWILPLLDQYAVLFAR